MTAALPKEDVPRCPDCKQPKCCTAKTRSGCRMMADTCHGGGGCDRVALRLERAAHQKTLDALAEVRRMTAIGPPLPPGGKRHAGDAWYSLAVRVHEFATAALRAGGRNV